VIEHHRAPDGEAETFWKIITVINNALITAKLFFP